MIVEIIIVGLILLFIVTYRASSGAGVYKFIVEQSNNLYNKYAPYSYKEMRKKIKDLGIDYTPRQYLTQIFLFAGFAGVVGYLYFYSIIVAVVYAVIAVAAIPYITYLRSKRQYSEFIFEQIQVYVTNTIMEFATTQAFIKSLEGVVESGILEDPVLTDVKTMIALSYEKGDVYDSITYMNTKYPFFMVKNMHQLFLQVTKEGAKDTQETFDNMLDDIMNCIKYECKECINQKNGERIKVKSKIIVTKGPKERFIIVGFQLDNHTKEITGYSYVIEIIYSLKKYPKFKFL